MFTLFKLSNQIKVQNVFLIILIFFFFNILLSDAWEPTIPGNAKCLNADDCEAIPSTSSKCYSVSDPGNHCTGGTEGYCMCVMNACKTATQSCDEPNINSKSQIDDTGYCPGLGNYYCYHFVT